MLDEQTRRTYDQKAKDYADRFASSEPPASLKRFMALLPPGAHVLDWGCGPARSSFHLQAAGFLPDPIDASSEMVKLAREHHQVNARLGAFDDALPTQHYHGAWVNFSLLHAPREAFPGHLKQLNKALKTDGVLHLGMKTGTGEKRDALGRFYTFYEMAELVRLLDEAGFNVLEIKEGQEAGLAGTVDPFALILSRKSEAAPTD